MSRTRGPVLTTVPVVREVIELIEASGWKDWQVAEIAGVSSGYISQLRKGIRTEVSLTCVDALLGVFGKRLVIGQARPGRGRVKQRRKPLRATMRAPKVRRPIAAETKRAYAGAEPTRDGSSGKIV